MASSRGPLCSPGGQISIGPDLERREKATRGGGGRRRAGRLFINFNFPEFCLRPHPSPFGRTHPRAHTRARRPVTTRATGRERAGGGRGKEGKETAEGKIRRFEISPGREVRAAELPDGVSDSRDGVARQEGAAATAAGSARIYDARRDWPASEIIYEIPG